MVRLRNLFWELRLGISTHGIFDVQFPDAYHYATMRYVTINRILEFLDLQPTDILVDIGSGKGRILCCAARSELRKVVGIEVAKELCEASEANAARMRGRKSPIAIHNSAAQEFDYAEGTVFTLFNPFGAATLAIVLESLERSWRARSRDIRIAYANPAHDDVFAQMKWLQRHEHWEKDTLRMEHSVSFYKSLPNT